MNLSVAEFRAAGATVVRDTFTASTPLGPIPMSNIVAKIPGDSSAVVIIAGHYDTKRSTFPFVGANDGGSSAAFLLEMARVLAQRKNSVSYWLLFFDGEEALQRWSNTDSLYGSRHFAQELSDQGTLHQIRALILVDMIADAHLDIYREAHSTRFTVPREKAGRKRREIPCIKTAFPSSASSATTSN